MPVYEFRCVRRAGTQRRSLEESKQPNGLPTSNTAKRVISLFNCDDVYALRSRVERSFQNLR